MRLRHAQQDLAHLPNPDCRPALGDSFRSGEARIGPVRRLDRRAVEHCCLEAGGAARSVRSGVLHVAHCDTPQLRVVGCLRRADAIVAVSTRRGVARAFGRGPRASTAASHPSELPALCAACRPRNRARTCARLARREFGHGPPSGISGDVAVPEGSTGMWEATVTRQRRCRAPHSRCVEVPSADGSATAGRDISLPRG